jgi:hypothetical protein
MSSNTTIATPKIELVKKYTQRVLGVVAHNYDTSTQELEIGKDHF